MHHYFEAITNNKGDALTGYYVGFVDSTGATVPVYADTSLTPILSVSGIANRVKVDSNGNVNCYLPLGTYTRNIYATDGTTLVNSTTNMPFNIDIEGLYGDAATLSQVASRTILAAVTASANAVRYLAESGREGTFVFNSSNNATNVTNDPQQGIYVASASDATGASGAWVRKFIGDFNPRWFGAQGDSNTTASIGTDDTAAITAALAYINATGGGTLRFPDGLFFKISGPSRIYANTRILGGSRKATTIVGNWVGASGATAADTLKNGSAFYSDFGINNGGDAHITIDHIAIKNVNAGSNGAAYYDTGGHEIAVEHTFISGFKHGVVFDQSEIAHVENCTINPLAGGGACVWIVNGNDLNPSGLQQVTNAISVARCQLNPGAASYCILDDGGVTHTFQDNNYNGGINGIRASGVAQGFLVIGGEYEAAATHCIDLQSTRLSGVSAGGSFGAVIGGTFTATTGHTCINVGSAGGGSLAVIGGSYGGGGGTNPITGVANLYRFSRIANTNNTTVSFTDANAAQDHFDDAHPMPINSNGGTAFTIGRANLNRLTRCTAATAITITITDDTTLSTKTTGKKLVFEQSAAGPLALVASGVTLNGDLTTNGQYQRLIGYETQANVWNFVRHGTANGIGYSAGVGGAVTQATSRTTGVTLNKVCGQITLFSAAGSASWQTFTVTNSQVAATDVIRLNQASGTDLYQAMVTNVAAGSFKVSFATTGGTTTEQPVFNFAIIKAVAA